VFIILLIKASRHDMAEILHKRRG